MVDGDKRICRDINDTQGNHHGWMIFCPGCRDYHVLDKRWTFNGNYDKPTFTPSYLVLAPAPRCHSFIRDGRIQFLGDCEHTLKGQTVDLEPF